MANIVDFYGVVVGGMTGVADINSAQTPFDVYNSNAQLVGSVLSLNPVAAIAVGPAETTLNIVKMTLDTIDTGTIGAGDVLSTLGNIAALEGGIVALGLALPEVGLALALTGLVTALASHYQPISDYRISIPGFGLPLGDTDGNGIPDILENRWIDPKTNRSYNDAKNWFPRYDPLTLDLDGDGIETVGTSSTNPILFDHDGDGIKNGTGWVSADDGMLVLDRNNNGNIDNGRELFGDNTIKSNGQTAKDGFDALSDLDSNADGIINANDSQFSNLRIWRDLNQARKGLPQFAKPVNRQAKCEDGVSQSNELFTLNSQNIASINVTSTQNNQTLTNGNQLADLGTYTKLDGTQGTVGETLNTTTSNPTGNLGDINLASDTFHRTFPNVLDTSTVANLPDMGGSGAVRDLREAANDKVNYTAGVREGTLAYGDWRMAA